MILSSGLGCLALKMIIGGQASVVSQLAPLLLLFGSCQDFGASLNHRKTT
jgi:hypothetical protein